MTDKTLFVNISGIIKKYRIDFFSYEKTLTHPNRSNL